MPSPSTFSRFYWFMRLSVRPHALLVAREANRLGKGAFQVVLAEQNQEQAGTKATPLAHLVESEATALAGPAALAALAALAA